MTPKEYQERMSAINKEAAEKIKELKIQYAQENNPYSVGDIIEDHIGKGRIKEILLAEVSYSYMLPQCVYLCDNLTRKGTVNKKEPTRQIWQNNII